MGDGIFVFDRPAWKTSRALLKPVFAKGQFGDLRRLEEDLGRLLALLPKDNATVNVQVLFQNLVSALASVKSIST